jgi:hypothetical protein
VVGKELRQRERKELTNDFELLHSLTETDILPWFNSAVLDKARRLYSAGRVSDPIRLDTILSAEIQDEDGSYYEAELSVEDGRVIADCDCEGDYCAHVGAVLLNWIHAPKDFALDSDASSPDFMDFIYELMADVESEELLADLDQSLAFDETPPTLVDAKVAAAEVERAIEQDLRNLLEEQTVQQLRAIARRRDWKLRGTRKDDLVDQLVGFYLEAQDTTRIADALDDDRRLALEFLALRASVVPTPESVVKKIVRSFKGRRSDQEATAILQNLQELGLFFATKGYTGTTYRVPAIIVRQLPPWPGLLAPFKDKPARLDTRQSATFALTQVVYQVWQYLREPPQPKKARSLPKKSRLEQQWPNLQGWLNPADELAELERMGSRLWYSGWQRNISVQPLPPALSETDLAELRQRTAATDDILDFIFNLMTALNFVQWEYGSDIQTDENRMTTFLSYSDATRLQILTTAWMGLEWWTEMALVLRHVNHLRLRRRLHQDNLTYNDLTQELAYARLIVVMLLRRLSPGAWYGAADFRQLLRRLWPDYLYAASTSSARRWWLETVSSDTLLSPEKAEEWAVGYAPFVTACLEGPLAWLGAVTLGYDRQSLAAFQLTDLGAYLLGLRPSYSQETEEPAGPPLTVHGDGTIIARTGYAASGVYDLLNVLGRLEETSAQQFRYRITAATAQRAFEQGWAGQAILDELERQSSEPVPEPLHSQILTWNEGYGQVHLYDEVTLVEFADDFALQELLASTSLVQHLVYQFSPRLVAVKTEAVDALRDELVRLGHTPRIE